MKNRVLTGMIGIALCTLALPADARPSRETSGPDGFESQARSMLNFDHPGHWSSRQRSYSDDGNERAPVAAPRRQAAPRVILASRGPDATAPAPAAHTPAANTPAPTAKPDIASRGVANVARGSSATARGCLTAAAKDLLGRIEAQFGPMQIVSTCRPGSVIPGTGRLSMHATGNAIDFNAGARKADVVRWLIANHKTGGIMTYAGMNHIHADIGYRFISLNSR